LFAKFSTLSDGGQSKLAAKYMCGGHNRDQSSFTAIYYSGQSKLTAKYVALRQISPRHITAASQLKKPQEVKWKNFCL
jgi:hypothetical protein